MWLVYAIAASALWGFEYALVGRILGDRFSPLFLVSLQMFVGAVTLGALALATGTLWQEGREVLADRTTVLLVLLSTLVFTAGNFMIAASIKEGNAVVAGFVEVSYPLFIVLASLALGWGGQFGWRTIAGGLIVLAGVMLLQSDQAA
jgi:drug/metabolite transporter (DMT)-like permease